MGNTNSLLEIRVPPDGTLLSSMLYEGLLRIKRECGEQPTKECLKNGLSKVIEEKNVDFRFVGNDVKYLKKYFMVKEELKKLDKKFIEILFKNVEVIDLRIKVELSKEKGKMKLRVGSLTRMGKEYSLQIMKADRYKGISSIDLQTIDEEITTYADVNGLIVFFYGLASAYVMLIGGNYYFLFFDEETLLRDVLRGDTDRWLELKDGVALAIRDAIEILSEFNDEAISLVVLLNTYALNTLKGWGALNTGFRLVKVSMEGQTYKVYLDTPLRIYVEQSLYKDPELIEELQRVLEVLLRPAGRFIRRVDKYGDGYHAFKALRYLYYYVISGNPEYLANTYREVREAYDIARSKGAPYARMYLRCFLEKRMGRY